MKTTRSPILILITLVTLAFMPNSFAQDVSDKVSLIYFLPKDRLPEPDIDTKMDILIRGVQRFYADHLENHGFGRKTFEFETDENGNAIVNHVDGHLTAEEYLYGIHRASSEIHEQLGPKIYLCMIDTGRGAYVYNGGVAFTSDPSYVPSAAHELGHAFGLQHDEFRSNIKLIPTAQISDDLMLTSFCSAAQLAVHPFFNTGERKINQNTDIQILPLTTSPSDAIRLRFNVTDPDELHLAILYTTFQSGTSKNGQLHVFNNWNIIDCKRIEGSSTTVEFVTNLLTKGSSSVDIKVLDVQGNSKIQGFRIDISHLLPSPEVISVPDPNLAEALRAKLALESTDDITQLDMLRLRLFEPIRSKNIADFTGLEHATNLRILALWSHPTRNVRPLIPIIKKLTNLRELRLTLNQIDDVGPLAELTNLKHLRELRLAGNKITDVSSLASLTGLHNLWLDYNQVSDITSLNELTNLRDLRLNNNQISNITPLASLKKLNRLWLSNNQISDVSPLAELTSLQALYLVRNPIKNREPLRALLRKKPDVKIYLKNDREPLPVTLSHFRAEHTDAGVVLKWTTESEVDNAGFYIYRSETKDGEFKVVNPTMIQGAGTTGERNEYTWTDTSAKPNTVYYYRIEDVSHAGKHEQLATVRLRGLVSARGKLISRWADLKDEY